MRTETAAAKIPPTIIETGLGRRTVAEAATLMGGVITDTVAHRTMLSFQALLAGADELAPGEDRAIFLAAEHISRHGIEGCDSALARSARRTAREIVSKAPSWQNAKDLPMSGATIGLAAR